jgi:hypothetical protein
MGKDVAIQNPHTSSVFDGDADFVADGLEMACKEFGQ